MRFKSPGGDLVWLTPLMALQAIYLTFHYAQVGAVGFVILYATLGVFSVLAWFDLKWVAIPVIVFFSLVFIAGSIMLIAKGFSWTLFGRLILVGYTIYGFWEWRNKVDV